MALRLELASGATNNCGWIHVYLPHILHSLKEGVSTSELI